MVDELDAAFDAGAFGLSSGLEYPLGARATTDELVAPRLGRRAAAMASYAIHTRDRDFRAVEAFDEAFAVAERSGAALQISHIAPRRGAPDGALADVLERIDRRRADGLDVACDQHTRHHGITKLVTMLPPSASAVGTDELLRQLRDPAMRALVPRLPRADPQARPDGRMGPSRAVRGAARLRSSSARTSRRSAASAVSTRSTR